MWVWLWGQAVFGSDCDLVLVSTALEPALGTVLWRALLCPTSNSAVFTRHLKSQGDLFM